MLTDFSFACVGAIDWNGHMDVDGAGWILMALGMLAFWGLLFLAIHLAIKTFGDRPGNARFDALGEDGLSPAAILDRRLAIGDISLKEFERRKRVLRGTEPASDGTRGDGRNDLADDALER